MGLVSEFDAFCVSFSLNSNLVLSAVNYLAKKYIFRVASSLQTRFSILRFSSHLGKRMNDLEYEQHYEFGYSNAWCDINIKKSNS